MNDTELFMTDEEIRRYKIKKTFANIGIYTFLVICALFILIPFYWMLSTAIRSSIELEQTNNVSFFPEKIYFRNFIEAFEFATSRNYNFLRFYWNTIFVGFITTIGTMITTILAAFAFARLNFKGKNVIFSIFLATMMIPGEIFVISNFMTISSLQWQNTYQALILPFITSVFYIFFLRQTFMQIPNELYLAAKVDGTSDFKYLMRVMIPMAKATLTTIFILSMMGTWNAYVWPNFVARDEDMQLVSNGLMNAFTDIAGKTALNFQMAASTAVTVPLLIVFLFLKKYIMRGVSRSGIKG